MYAKLFRQIFKGSLAEDWMLRHVFMDLLILADQEGVVDMTIGAIARETNGSPELIAECICKLCKPDSESRNPAHEGRRLLPLAEGRSWGWRIVNYEEYRKMRDEDERREYMRKYMQEYRKRPRNEGGVNSVNTGKPQLAHTDTEAYTEAEPDAPTGAASPKKGKKKRKPKPEKEPGPNVYGWWIDAHDHLKRPRPTRSEKEVGAAKLIGKWMIEANVSEDDVKWAMLAYLEDDDDFVTRNGYTLSLLQPRIGGYLQRAKREHEQSRRDHGEWTERDEERERRLQEEAVACQK